MSKLKNLDIDQLFKRYFNLNNGEKIITIKEEIDILDHYLKKCVTTFSDSEFSRISALKMGWEIFYKYFMDVSQTTPIECYIKFLRLETYEKKRALYHVFKFSLPEQRAHLKNRIKWQTSIELFLAERVLKDIKKEKEKMN